jgi:hypothetical protein
MPSWSSSLPIRHEVDDFPSTIEDRTELQNFDPVALV